MGEIGRGSLRGTLLVLLAAFCSAEEMEKCASKTCCYLSNSADSVTMECDLMGEISVFQSRNSSAQHIKIKNGSLLYIEKGSLTNKPNLKSIHIVNISRVVYEDDRASKPVQNFSMIIENVKQLDLNQNSFSGWSNRGSHVQIKNVATCSLVASAFPVSSTLGRISFNNVGSLIAAGGAFSAAIDHLTLQGVKMERCETGLFAGRIGELSLSSVEIGTLQGGCVHAAAAGWGRLAVRSAQLGQVRPLAFRGAIGEVSVADSSIISVDSAGFHLRVATFSVRSSSIRDLSARALQVEADRSVSLEDSHLEVLPANSLDGLRVGGGGGSASRPLRIARLTVGRAEDGSLNVTSGAEVELRDVQLRAPCDCDVDGWACRLTFGTNCTNTTELTARQRELLLEIQRGVHCVDRSALTTRPSLAVFFCQRCGERSDGEEMCSATPLPEPRRDPQLSWVPYTAGGAALLLFLLLVVIACLVHRRRQKLVKHWLAGELELQQRAGVPPDYDCRYSAGSKSAHSLCRDEFEPPGAAGGPAPNHYEKLPASFCSSCVPQENIYAELSPVKCIPPTPPTTDADVCKNRNSLEDESGYVKSSVMLKISIARGAQSSPGQPVYENCPKDGGARCAGATESQLSCDVGRDGVEPLYDDIVLHCDMQQHVTPSDQ